MQVQLHKNLVCNPGQGSYENFGVHSFIGDSLLDYIKCAAEGSKEGTGFKIVSPDDVKINCVGRKAKGWDEVISMLHTPWPEAVQFVNTISEMVQKHPLPEPHDIRRKMRWNDTDGELNIDRAMKGEADMYRQPHRRRIKAPSQIVLLSNLDCPGLCNSLGIFFRSIATIVLADILESKGYGVEIWSWCAGYRVFKGRDHGQFNSVQIKKSDQPLDKDTVCNGLSSWFTQFAIWASWNYKANPVSYGCMIGSLDMQAEDYFLPEKQEPKLRQMLSLIEPEEGKAQTYMIPSMWGYDVELAQETKYRTEMHWAVDAEGNRKRNPKGLFYKEPRQVAYKETIQVPVNYKNEKGIKAIVKICTDILNKIIQRESE